MKKAEYKEYEKSVADFFQVEGITNLSGNVMTCPDCYFDFSQDGVDENIVKCGCGYTMENINESEFSWHSCDCCGTQLGGTRYKASGYNPNLKEIFVYEICQDCLYYAAYGTLDDMTMMDMED